MSEEHLVYVKYDGSLLNILDAQKGILTLKNPILLENTKNGKLDNFCFYISLLNFCILSETSNSLFALLDTTYWIDPSQANPNLLATGGTSKKINVYDKRNSQIIKTFEDTAFLNFFKRQSFKSGQIKVKFSVDFISCIKYFLNSDLLLRIYVPLLKKTIKNYYMQKL